MSYKQKGWSPFTKVEVKPYDGLEEPKKKRKKRKDLNEVDIKSSEGSSDVQPWAEPGAYAHASWSPLMKNGKKDPPKKKYPKHYTKEDIKFLKDQNEDIVRDEDKTLGQDIVKSVKDQIKDLEQDIVKLKSRNNSGDRKRIQKLTQEIKRLKSK